MPCSTPPRSLSSAIDPGITISPCIALTTEERSNMLRRRCLAEKCTQVQLHRGKTFALCCSCVIHHRRYYSRHHQSKKCSGNPPPKLFVLHITLRVFLFCFCRSCSHFLLHRISQCGMSKENFSSFQFIGMCSSPHLSILLPPNKY